MGQRLQALRGWLQEGLGLEVRDLQPASGDASFRRYFRVFLDQGTQIAVDAPPEREDSHPFVAVAGWLGEIGLCVPEILASDLGRGFLLVSDLGTRSYLDELTEQSVERLYGDALRALLTLQACGPADDRLPGYDQALLMREMGLFRDWYLQRHLGLVLSPSEEQALGQQFGLLAEQALSQPQVCVHRDFHSRNLMFYPPQNPGILDFQDAVVGPVTYDLVSLLRDCYIAWPRERAEDWALGYQEQALQAGVLEECYGDEDLFLRWFDWMGVQRHLKAVGIFARLNHRDAKSGYLQDIPRTLGYLQEVTGRYPELQPLHRLLAERVPV